jgi:AbrB family looped-hinge helix DNA binding protein
METKLSTKGQVVVPNNIRRKLDLRPGDSLEATLEGKRIVLTPRTTRERSARLTKDPLTGLPALTAGPKASKLTSAQVRELLAEFP